MNPFSGASIVTVLVPQDSGVGSKSLHRDTSKRYCVSGISKPLPYPVLDGACQDSKTSELEVAAIAFPLAI